MANVKRLHWADAGKAIAIVLVVLFHVGPPGVSGDGNVARQYVVAFSSALLPVRMPLFFLISGVLSRRAVNREWRTELRKKTGNLLWVFVLWTLVYVGVYAVVHDLRGWDSVKPFAWMFKFTGPYWYLPMLAFFFVAAKALRAVTPWLTIPVAFLLRAVASGAFVGGGAFLIAEGNTLWRFMMFFVWYVIGVYGVRIVDSVVNISRFLWLPAVGIYGYLVLGLSAEHENVPAFIFTVVGVVAVIGFSELLVRNSHVRSFFRYLAQRTLPIYIFHPLILLGMKPFFVSVAGLTSFQTYGLTFGLTAGLVAISCFLWDMLQPRFPFLFRVPQPQIA